MTMEPRQSILNAVRAELEQTERRLEQLRELERLAVELAGDMIEQTAAAAVAPARPPKARRAPRRRRLSVDEVLDGIRDAMHEGPVSLNQLHQALGIGVSAHSTGVIRDALEQLGAVTAGKRTGGLLYALPNGNGAVAAPPAPPDVEEEDVDAAYLERRVVDVLRREPMLVDDLAAAIDAPAEAVRAACQRLTEAGECSLMADGRYVG
jgi:hypothetical protein